MSGSGTVSAAQNLAEAIGADATPLAQAAQLAAEAIGADPTPPAKAAQLAAEAIGADPTTLTKVFQLVVEIIAGSPPNPSLIMRRRRWPLSYLGYPPRPPFAGNPYA